MKEIPQGIPNIIANISFINLAAKQALSTFGTLEEDKEDHELPMSMMDICLITNEQGGFNLNLKTVLKASTALTYLLEDHHNNERGFFKWSD